MTKEPEVWGSEGDENLQHDNEDDAIEAILEDMEEPYPDMITICGFARMEADVELTNPLEHCLEYLDDEFGDPDEYTKPTEAMKEAEKVFLAVLKKEYVPWACEQVCKKEIGVADWIKANRPQWKATP